VHKEYRRFFSALELRSRWSKLVVSSLHALQRFEKQYEGIAERCSVLTDGGGGWRWTITAHGEARTGTFS
jgi:hypothetical protein